MVVLFVYPSATETKSQTFPFNFSLDWSFMFDLATGGPITVLANIVYNLLIGWTFLWKFTDYETNAICRNFVKPDHAGYHVIGNWCADEKDHIIIKYSYQKSDTFDCFLIYDFLTESNRIQFNTSNWILSSLIRIENLIIVILYRRSDSCFFSQEVYE